MSLLLKRIEQSDADTLFLWRNDPSIWPLGSEKRKVTREEHDIWFQNVLSDLRSFNFIIINDTVKVGQVRLNFVTEGVYKISIFLLSQFRGKNIGSQVLSYLIQNVLEKNQSILADVSIDNSTSKCFFIKNGFLIIDNDENHYYLKKTI